MPRKRSKKVKKAKQPTAMDYPDWALLTTKKEPTFWRHFVAIAQIRKMNSARKMQKWVNFHLCKDSFEDFAYNHDEEVAPPTPTKDMQIYVNRDKEKPTFPEHKGFESCNCKICVASAVNYEALDGAFDQLTKYEEDEIERLMAEIKLGADSEYKAIAEKINKACVDVYGEHKRQTKKTTKRDKPDESKWQKKQPKAIGSIVKKFICRIIPCLSKTADDQ